MGYATVLAVAWKQIKYDDGSDGYKRNAEISWQSYESAAEVRGKVAAKVRDPILRDPAAAV